MNFMEYANSQRWDDDDIDGLTDEELEAYLSQGQGLSEAPAENRNKRVNRKNGDVSAVQELAARADPVPPSLRRPVDGGYPPDDLFNNMAVPGVQLPAPTTVPPAEAPVVATPQYGSQFPNHGATEMPPPRYGPPPPSVPPSTDVRVQQEEQRQAALRYDSQFPSHEDIEMPPNSAAAAVAAAERVKQEEQRQAALRYDSQFPNHGATEMPPPSYEPPPPSRLPLSNIYSDTIYGDLTAQQRELMQLQPNESYNSLRRTAESVNVPVEFLGMNDGSTRPVIGKDQESRLRNLSDRENPNMRGTIFSDEVVDGVPTFNNESIRRRVDLGWMPNPEEESARIERDQLEAYMKTPEARALSHAERIEREALDRTLEGEKSIAEINAWGRILQGTGGVAGGRAGGGGTSGEQRDNAPNIPDMAARIRDNLNAAGLPTEDRDYEAAASGLLMQADREAAAGNLPPPSEDFGQPEIEDLAFLSLALAERTSGFGMRPGEGGLFSSPFDRPRPGQWASAGLGDTLNTLADLYAADVAGTPERSGGQRFRFFKDMSGPEQVAFMRLLPAIETNLMNRPAGDATSQRFVNSQISEIERELEEVTRELQSIDRIRSRLSTNRVEGVDHYATTNEREFDRDQLRLRLKDEETELREDLAKFIAAQRRGA